MEQQYQVTSITSNHTQNLVKIYCFIEQLDKDDLASTMTAFSEEVIRNKD